jgi:hypothetical protein
MANRPAVHRRFGFAHCLFAACLDAIHHGVQLASASFCGAIT